MLHCAGASTQARFSISGRRRVSPARAAGDAVNAAGTTNTLVPAALIARKSPGSAGRSTPSARAARTACRRRRCARRVRRPGIPGSAPCIGHTISNRCNLVVARTMPARIEEQRVRRDRPRRAKRQRAAEQPDAVTCAASLVGNACSGPRPSVPASQQAGGRMASMQNQLGNATSPAPAGQRPGDQPVGGRELASDRHRHTSGSGRYGHRRGTARIGTPMQQSPVCCNVFRKPCAR